MSSPRLLETPTGGAIDVHAHYLPRRYRDAALAAGQGQPDGLPALPEWSAGGALALMDDAGVDAALLSLSTPGASFAQPGARRAELLRGTNEDGAETVRRHPHRFGLLASLPLPDVELSLLELEHALDHLGADGICLLTHYDGVYLGNAALEPLMAELDRRQAVVFLHPTSPACWEPVSFGRPRALVEYLFDTTRAVFNLILSGTLSRYPRIRLIVPHTGAALPILADRVQALGPLIATDAGTGQIDVLTQLRALYYDLAGTPVPRALSSLRSISAAENLLYGSDFPYTPAHVVRVLAQRLSDDGGLSSRERSAVLRTNAFALFPRFER